MKLPTTLVHLAPSSFVASSLLSLRGGRLHMSAAQFIDEVNSQYEVLHRDFEQQVCRSPPPRKARLRFCRVCKAWADAHAHARPCQFWGTKMALSGDYSVSKLTETKEKMEAFLADADKLKRTRELQGEAALSETQQMTLKLFER
eukprot:5753750-Prymnesium_polylepis.1